MDLKAIEQAVFSIKNEDDFIGMALEIFNYQYHHVEIYHRYCDLLGIDIGNVKALSDIPFMPIDFFRSHRVSPFQERAELTFSSSGTTGNHTSYHEIPYPHIYEKSFRSDFERFYGSVKDYCILALLPSYLERNGSSLVYMADRLIADSGHPHSGFYLHNLDALAYTLEILKKQGQKTLLLGVTYALLDLATAHPMHFPDLVIMETGGMKGKRREMVREEVHQILCNAFHCDAIHSEYGMTELLSQAYSYGNGIYRCPPWMLVTTRDTDDPLSTTPNNTTGGINVIDLANIYSCSFIATQDLGKCHDDGTFEVLGRFDNSLIRGCNLMVI